MTRIFLALALGLAMLPSSGRVAEAADAGSGKSLELAVKATFLDKFEPFVTWPEAAFSTPTAPFALCVIGDNPLGALIDRAVSGQSYGAHEIRVYRLPTLSSNSLCHLAYIGTQNPQSALQALNAVQNMPVLTVTDSIRDNAAKGIINFVTADNRVRFEIDEAAATRNGLAISSKLLSLAIAVKGGP